MSSNDQSTPLKLDLKGFTARQYAALILRDDLGYSYERAGRHLGINRFAFRELYKRAIYKHETKTIYANSNFLLQQKRS
jgi:DNA-directed RNA polymerase specialized sigma24 family protein